MLCEVDAAKAIGGIRMKVTTALQKSEKKQVWTIAKVVRSVIKGIGWCALLFGGILMVMPIIWMLSSSLKTSDKIFSIPIQLIPNPVHFQNYIEAVQLAPLGRYFLNSVGVGLSITFLTLFFSTMAGYGFAKFQFWGRNTLFIAVLSTMMIPFQVIMIPLYILVRYFGWLNSYAGLIIPAAISAFGVFLMRQFIQTIPNELLDAARIDGASEIGIFFRIILPLCKPPLTALAIFTFLDSWNNLLWPLIIISKVELRPLALGLSEYQTIHGTSYNYLMAAATLATIPILVLFALLQKQFIRGVVLSGMK
jgi:multiple sugar transport system permease protein